jgi:hypothetical protein
MNWYLIGQVLGSPVDAFRETKLYPLDSHIGDGRHFENMDKSYFYFVIIYVVPCNLPSHP